jgi:hypothetical protein
MPGVGSWAPEMCVLRIRLFALKKAALALGTRLEKSCQTKIHSVNPGASGEQCPL